MSGSERKMFDPSFPWSLAAAAQPSPAAFYPWTSYGPAAAAYFTPWGAAAVPPSLPYSQSVPSLHSSWLEGNSQQSQLLPHPPSWWPLLDPSLARAAPSHMGWLSQQQPQMLLSSPVLAPFKAANILGGSQKPTEKHHTHPGSSTKSPLVKNGSDSTTVPNLPSVETASHSQEPLLLGSSRHTYTMAGLHAFSPYSKHSTPPPLSSKATLAPTAQSADVCLDLSMPKGQGETSGGCAERTLLALTDTRAAGAVTPTVSRCGAKIERDNGKKASIPIGIAVAWQRQQEDVTDKHAKIEQTRERLQLHPHSGNSLTSQPANLPVVPLWLQAGYGLLPQTMRPACAPQSPVPCDVASLNNFKDSSSSGSKASSEAVCGTTATPPPPAVSRSRAAGASSARVYQCPPISGTTIESPPASFAALDVVGKIPDEKPLVEHCSRTLSQSPAIDGKKFKIDPPSDHAKNGRTCNDNEDALVSKLTAGGASCHEVASELAQCTTAKPRRWQDGRCGEKSEEHVESAAGAVFQPPVLWAPHRGTDLHRGEELVANEAASKELIQSDQERTITKPAARAMVRSRTSIKNKAVTSSEDEPVSNRQRLPLRRSQRSPSRKQESIRVHAEEASADGLVTGSCETVPVASSPEAVKRVTASKRSGGSKRERSKNGQPNEESGEDDVVVLCDSKTFRLTQDENALIALERLLKERLKVVSRQAKVNRCELNKLASDGSEESNASEADEAQHHRQGANSGRAAPSTKSSSRIRANPPPRAQKPSCPDKRITSSSTSSQPVGPGGKRRCVTVSGLVPSETPSPPIQLAVGIVSHPSSAAEVRVTAEDLQDGTRLLVCISGLLYEATVVCIEPPSVYGALIAGERGARPRVYARDDLLRESYRDVRPLGASGGSEELQPGARVCAYWSELFGCLYPGVVTAVCSRRTSGSVGSASSRTSRTSASSGAVSATAASELPPLIDIEFDDGDSGKFALEQIRLLPASFPRSTQQQQRYDDAPSVVSLKRRRSAAAVETPAASSAVTSRPASPLSARVVGSSEGRRQRVFSIRLLRTTTTAAKANASCSITSVTETTAEEEMEDDEGQEDTVADRDEVFGDNNSDDEPLQTYKARRYKALLSTGQEWEWCGTPMSNMKDTCSSRGRASRGTRNDYYSEICRGHEKIKVGDCAVFVSREEKKPPYVGKILSMWQGRRSQRKVVRVQWFYHPEETRRAAAAAYCDGLQDSLKGALYESEHIDENSVQTISHRCDVLPLAEYRRCGLDRRAASEVARHTAFYIAGTYDAGRGRITSLANEDC